MDFIAPYTANERHTDYLYAPPQAIHLFHDGNFIGPYVQPTTAHADLVKFRGEYTADPDHPAPIQFFCHAGKYRLFGLVPSDRHLFLRASKGLRCFFLGSDRLGFGICCRAFCWGHSCR